MVTAEQLEVEQLRQANQKLLADLAHERSLRHTAEEEQLRTEQELSAIMLELRAAQRQAGQGGGDGAAAPQLQADLETLLAELDRERAHSTQLATAVQTAQAEVHALRQRLQQAEQQHGGGGLRPVGSSASMAEAGGDAAGLSQRVATLKAARDKLIAALDLQAAEVERLSAENAALTEAVAELRDVAAKWEAQAQQGLAQNERLKDLLEETATWDAAAAAQAQAGSSDSGAARARDAGAAGASPSGSSAAELEALCGRLQRELLLERAKTAQLDVQVRALCMELTKSSQRSGQMQHSLVPLLSGVERRLAEVLGMRPKAPAVAVGES